MQQPTAAQFLAQNRGGGLFTEAVNQRAGSHLAVIASRLGLAPTTLSLINLGLATAASTGVLLLAPRIAAGGNAWPIGVGALLLWQLAYSFDCADGQLARVTGRASPAGGRVDLLCDVAVQVGLVAAISAVTSGRAPVWLIATFSGTWLVNLITSILASSPGAASLLTSTSSAVRMVKLVRDYGAMIAVCGASIAFVPRLTPAIMVAFCLTNGGFLAISIAQAAVAAYRADGKLTSSRARSM